MTELTHKNALFCEWLVEVADLYREQDPDRNYMDLLKLWEGQYHRGKTPHQAVTQLLTPQATEPTDA